MDTKFKLKDHFFLSVLTLHLVKLRKTHRYDCRVRKAQNSLAYISSGSVKFSIMNETITAHAGDLIFVPEGNRYISHWSGSPDIDLNTVNGPAAGAKARSRGWAFPCPRLPAANPYCLNPESCAIMENRFLGPNAAAACAYGL